MPLKPLLEADTAIEKVFVITPAASLRAELFYAYGPKFEIIANPAEQDAHDNLIGELRPDVIVTPTVGLDDKDVPLIRAGKKHGIPTLTFIASWDNVYKIERSLKTGRDIEIPDYVAVWNEMKRSHFLRIFPKYSPERIVITGAPRFDFFSHGERIPSRQKLLEFVGLSHDALLLHGATTELYPFDYIIEAMNRAKKAGELSQALRWYVSVHPGGDMAKQARARDLGAVVQYSFGRRDKIQMSEFRYFPTPAEIYMHVALFKQAVILINQSSTVTIESMLAGVPVINVKYGRPWDFWRWRRSMVYRDFNEHYRDIVEGGGTSIATSRQELVAETQKYLRDPLYKSVERQATVRKMLTYTDGSASGRLLAFIKQAAVK